MSYGRVYLGVPDAVHPLGYRVTAAVVPLQHLDPATDGQPRLSGRYARVHNGGWINVPSSTTEASHPTPTAEPLGDAQPNAAGDFLFEPGRGGGRLDKVVLADQAMRARYVQAAHFGEVNTYYHLDRIASYVDGLLGRLGAPSLPPVVAVVNAHHAATEVDGVRDGIRGRRRWLPFQGGHYRLPSRRYDIAEPAPLSADGEIHLGPGWRLLEYGGLVEAVGGRTRANASQNAGIIYHEYGHHITRHTADFRANALRSPQRQDNYKTGMDEGTCDYWAAAMLGTPHIWYWHRRHDAEEIHPRSLSSSRTMADYDYRRGADAHTNGTIWGATLWDLRRRISEHPGDGTLVSDLLVLQALLLLGRRVPADEEPRIRAIRRCREPFSAGLAALLEADDILYGRRHCTIIQATFARRGIVIEEDGKAGGPDPLTISLQAGTNPVTLRPHAPALLRHVAPDEIPASEDIMSAAALDRLLAAQDDPPLALLIGGDIMLGGRCKPAIAEYGPDYPFAAVLPLLRRASIVLGNLEGPFARLAHKVDRNYSYRVNPALAGALARAGIHVVTLANNHLLDCGRAGVTETIEALKEADVAPLGAGPDATAAHAPVIKQAGRWKVGLLGYYWNARCAATADSPGCAMDTREALEADIQGLRDRVDRIVVTFHWGIPYDREPQPMDVAKAHFAIECGAHAVIGHHPHVIQPIEVYRGCPIVYSVGNFAFGSGNSQAEGMLVGLRFDQGRTGIDLYPLYVKNRDRRVHYQPKVLAGASGTRLLRRLAEATTLAGRKMQVAEWRLRLEL